LGDTVPDLQLSQIVTVNLAMFNVAEVEFGGSTIATGVIEDISLETNEITIRLNFIF